MNLPSSSRRTYVLPEAPPPRPPTGSPAPPPLKADPDRNCPRCHTVLTDPHGIGLCPRCGFCRSLAVEGVAQVTVMGGVLKQYQVVTTPERLLAYDVTLDQLTEAAAKANAVAGGGVMQRQARESILRISARSLTLQDIEQAPVVWRGPQPVLIKDVADVRFAGPVQRGDGSVSVRAEGAVAGGPAGASFQAAITCKLAD